MKTLLLLACFLLATSLLEVAAKKHHDDKCEKRGSLSPLKKGEYDFIIVGGGTAGAIVAARLSSQFNVLLLESGDRLYDDATLSAKLLSDVLVGHDTAPLFDKLNPLIKGIASFKADGAIVDEAGNKIGTVDQGIPGFMPHIQGTPFMAFYMSMSEAAHYYPTVPQIFSQKREIDYPRGNALGGSSAANTMVYFRGSERDFNEWGRDLGLQGWDFKSVLPYFKKFENNQDVKDPSVHGFGGPINITISKYHFASPATDEYTKAALKLGYPKIEDASNPKTVYGASDSWQSFVGADGRRSDSSAYIRLLDAQGKVCWNKLLAECFPSQTLHIWTKKYVTKVLVNQDKRAYGVQYVDEALKYEFDKTEHTKKGLKDSEGAKHHSPFNKWDRLDVQKHNERMGAPVAKELAFDWERVDSQYIPGNKPDYTDILKTVTAKYEVILSAGAVASAQIMLLSGIGPRDHLYERSIDVVADLPVGRRMQDHQEVIVTYKFPESTKPAFDMISETLKGFPELRTHLSGKRSFYSSNGVPAGLEGSSKGPSGAIPKWHLHHITMGSFENFDWNIASYPETITPPYRIPRSVFELYRWKGLTLHSHNCELSQNHAYGRLELRSSDPFQPPFLDPRYGSSDEDNAEMVHCIQTVRELMKVSDPQWVGEELEPSRSAKTTEQLLQFVRNNVWGHHISGSTPMGNCTTWYAVTDEQARVYKVDGLRVADISLVPTLPHGNPAGVVMMMGEKIADMILNTWEHELHNQRRSEL
jgi:choline dehydrogenase-like flavoprotein